MTVRVTARDVLSCGMCMHGARKWCARHNIDFKEFVKSGVDSDILFRTQDNLQNVQAVVDAAIRREKQWADKKNK